MEVATPAMIVHPHPLVGDGTITCVAQFEPGETLGRYIARNGVRIPASDVLVWHNGHPVPAELWKRLIPKTGDQVVIRARMTNGNGGKVLRTVAMIALVLAAPELGALLAESAFGTALGLSASAATGLVLVGGSLVINALIPVSPATADQMAVGAKYTSSPTYMISGGRNRLRPWEPMPLIFGKHRVVPDAAANPYSTWSGNTQFFNQAFHFGLQGGLVELSDFRIGNTPIDNYRGVQLQVSGSDGRLPMIAGNVDTIQGATLPQGEEYLRTTARDVVGIDVDIAAQLYYLRDDGGMDGRESIIRVQIRPVGGAWQDIAWRQEAVYATHYWSQEWIGGWSPGTQYAYGSTNYSDHTEGDIELVSMGPGLPDARVVWRWRPHPHSLGQPWQGYAPDPVITYGSVPGLRLWNASQDVYRQTISQAVAKGQYEIRIWKESPDIKDSRQSNETSVIQVRAIQTDEADYWGQLRAALRIQASEQLQGAVDELSAMASAGCPVWTGSEWEFQRTSNPAWWFLWFARGRYYNSRRVYGLGLPDEEIDISGLIAWAAWCEAKGLTFDYVLDRAMSGYDVLKMIARAGRASVTRQTGKLGVVWDAEDIPVTAMIGPFNIKAGSFKIDYINDEPPSEIVGNFVNAAIGYELDEVRVQVPYSGATGQPLSLDLEGITDAAIAGQEVNLVAASQIWHRRRVSWEMDIEGWTSPRGSVVQCSHDLTVWGYSGRIMGRDGNIITLDKSIPTDGSAIFMLRDPENGMRTVTGIAPPGESDTFTITSDLTGFPLPGDLGYQDLPPFDWAWFADPLATPGRRLKIVEVKPVGDFGVALSAVDDSPEYYASANDPFVHVPPRGAALLAGMVFGLSFTETLLSVESDLHSVRISWALSTAMPARVVVSVNGQERISQVMSDKAVVVQARTRDVIMATITPMPSSGMAGTPASQTYPVVGLDTPLPAVTGLTNVFRDGLTALVWDDVKDPRRPGYEVRVGAGWDEGKTVAQVDAASTLAVGNGLYWVAARFVSRGHTIYGPPDSLMISGATLSRNILITVQEDPAWDGDVTDGAFVLDDLLTLSGSFDILSVDDVLALDDVLWSGNATGTGSYETNDANIVDIGFVTPVRLVFDIQEYALNFNEDILGLADILSSPDILNGGNRQHYSVRPQLRHAGEDEVWTDWMDYVPGLVNARYFDVRLVLSSDDPMIVPFVDHFSWSVDVPDMIQQGTFITIPSAGDRIEYEREFHIVPNVQIAIFDAQDGDRYVLTNADETGFDIRMYNGSTAVERQINWLSQGY